MEFIPKQYSEPYTLENLREFNDSYHHEHYLSEIDLTWANIMLFAIERSRHGLANSPKPGDIVMYKNKRGETLPAHVEKIESNGEISICLNAYTPFVSALFDSNNRIRISTHTSGGPWEYIPADSLKATNKRITKRFTFFGNGGMQRNGAVDIKALVYVYSYTEK